MWAGRKKKHEKRQRGRCKKRATQARRHFCPRARISGLSSTFLLDQHSFFGIEKKTNQIGWQHDSTARH